MHRQTATAMSTSQTAESLSEYISHSSTVSNSNKNGTPSTASRYFNFKKTSSIFHLVAFNSGYGSNYGGALTSEDSLSLQSVECECTPGEIAEQTLSQSQTKQVSGLC